MQGQREAGQGVLEEARVAVPGAQGDRAGSGGAGGGQSLGGPTRGELLRWMVLVLGLPEPVLQYRVDIRTGERFIDLCWPELRIAVEFDGRLKYRTGDDVFAEKLRQDDIQAQGWIFLRVTWEDLREMRLVADRLLALFPAEVIARLKPVPDLEGVGLWGSVPEGSLVP